MTISIVVADDHSIVRHGLRTLLEAESDFKVVGEAANGSEAIRLVEELSPDVLILDMVMPGIGGLEVIERLKASSPNTKVVVLSMHRNEAYVQASLRNGASAYVLKGSPSSELMEGIHAAVDGKIFLSRPLSERAIEAYAQRLNPQEVDSFDTLTSREREILKMTVEGFKTQEIAVKLAISPRTVETHRTNLMNKLDIHSQLELLRYAIKRGLLPREE
ncbi:MAG: response regulator transcription factor [Chloroflexi bacterium]|nr:response regulator transcription factor [Chloroflexota bacterium]